MARDERLGRQAAGGAPGRGGRPGQPTRPAVDAAAEAARREAGGGRSLLAAGAAVLVVAAGGYLLLGRGANRPPSADPGGAGAGLVAQAAAGRPVLTRVDLTSQMPDRSEELAAVVEARDPDGDPVTYAYEWLVNGEPAGETGERLSLATFAPGDRVAVRVTAFDAEGPGETRVSAPAIIENRLPELTRVDIAPTPPKPGEPLRLEIEAADPDGDEVAYGIEWLVNDEIVAGAVEPVLDGSKVVSGARIVAVVTPRDPYGEGPKRTSPFVQVGNRAPEITSAPPAGLDGDRFHYQVVAADPDGDPLSYHLEEGPAGMTVDPKTGAVEWSPTLLPGDTASVAVRAEDGKGGQAVQRFTIQTRQSS
ncbi:MAG TPA: putative Ig domain-containing protein [Thermodesulfobacteriota bacterium]